MTTIEEAENKIRDLKNWVFVFAKEYSLAEEAVKLLHEKIDELAVVVGDIKTQ